MSLEITKPPIRHVNRELEWGCALVLLAIAIALLMPGATFSRPTMLPMARLAPETTWGVALLGISSVRMLALWVNGNWHRSPALRFVTAISGAAVWATLSWLLAHDGFSGVNMGAFAYGALCLLDVISAIRSIRDQGRNDRRTALAKKAG